jgi:hypothetical protein
MAAELRETRRKTYYRGAFIAAVTSAFVCGAAEACTLM